MSDLDEGALPGIGGRQFKRPNLEKLVCEALATDQRVDASQVGVALDEATGDLTLFGTVPVKEQLQFAQDCAASVKGIHVVHSRLTVASSKAGSETETRAT
ncbi:MAG TPA: BON domain-containing protein [Woeseiaceae bacterium]|nr:BON domain-containing protein [Woeseiaceae bacterium]